MGRAPIYIRELTEDRHIHDIVFLAELHHRECAPHLSFKPPSVILNCERVLKDPERKFLNCWIAYQDQKPIGYAVAYCDRFFFNEDNTSKLEIWYVVPEARGSWAAVKLMKAYEEWARLNGCVQIYAGVARTDTDEAKHIRKLFPKLGYNWCGSYYIKETVKNV